MRYGLVLALFFAVFAGCSAPGPVAILSVASPAGRSTNLALGPCAESVQAAQQFTARSDWPAVALGYRLDDVTYYTKETYEYQSGFDRSGGLYHATQNVQTGVWLP